VTNSVQGNPPAAIVLYNPIVEILGELLAAINRDNRRLFIFVNGPLAPSAERLLTSLPNVNIERSPENVGLGAGLNAVMTSADREGFQHILLFDQDSTPSGSMASALLDRFVALDRPPHPLAALGPRLTPPKEGNYVPIRYWRRQGRNRVSGSVDFLPTSGSLVSLAAWRIVGPFRSDYFIGGIDVEWGYRCWALGFASVVADDIAMTHRWGREDPEGQGGGSQILREDDRRIYYYVRNTADGLGLPYMPFRWKARQTATLVGQVLLVLISKRRAKHSAKLFARAFRDGRQGRLGVAPDDLFAGQ
jgi:rhamnosyltransferase